MTDKNIVIRWRLVLEKANSRLISKFLFVFAEVLLVADDLRKPLSAEAQVHADGHQQRDEAEPG